jgi:hypothetical protein
MEKVIVTEEFVFNCYNQFIFDCYYKYDLLMYMPADAWEREFFELNPHYCYDTKNQSKPEGGRKEYGNQ